MKNVRLSLLVIAIVWGMTACKKDNAGNDAGTTPDNSSPTPAYGLGAKLNPDGFRNMRHINFDEVRARMTRLGFGEKVSANAKAAALPSSIILNHPSIGNQGNTGTCVSWASGYALSGTLNNEFPVSGVTNPRSPWYVYQMDHSAAGNCDPNDGMYLTPGLDILINYGVPTYAADPSLGSPCRRPTAAMDASAASDKVVNYAALSNLNDVKTALSMHLPVLMGFTVYSSFETAFNNGSTFKTISGSVLGGHAVCIIGYNDAKNAVLIQNSWGTSGGDASNRGCVWIDYNTLFNSRMQVELYSVWK